MLVIRGHVDRMRRERLHAYLVHASLIESKDRVDMFEAMPLPFDDELHEEGALDQMQTEEEALRAYNQALEHFNKTDPLKINNGG